jgi:acyl carrier protein
MAPCAGDRVAAIVIRAAHLSLDQALDRDTPLIGSGVSLDSVAVLDLLVELENEFHVELDPDEMLPAEALKTIGTLADFIASKAERQGDAP